MYGVVRSYKNASALSQALQRNEDEVRRLISGAPGFVAYYALHQGGDVVSVSICQDKAGADETVRIAREWIAANLANASGLKPEITEGEVFLNIGA